MYVKKLDENDELLLKQRREKIKEFQENGVCFSCKDFITGDIFRDNGLIIYEDGFVRCQ
ncbi:hypothetical protein [Clostridium sp.]|uniref:hypothetical protein n=1 Tax=Clostridium sp. TaxID=1506 RepID=UPI00284045CE|nr:hypothetical protein [Clostridium sp.]MDR3598475.1 hypothetical protein [Clostridium sp.]